MVNSECYVQYHLLGVLYFNMLKLVYSTRFMATKAYLLGSISLLRGAWFTGTTFVTSWLTHGLASCILLAFGADCVFY